MEGSGFMGLSLILIHFLGWSRSHNYDITEWKPFEKSLNSSDNAGGGLDLHGKRLHLVNFVSRSGIFDYDVSTRRASGSMGDIWEALAEFLNFTFEITDSNQSSYQTMLSTINICASLEGARTQERCRIVPFIGIHRNQLDTLDFTNCFFKDGNQLYIRPDYHFKHYWMMDIYSTKIWFSIILFYSTSIVICMVTKNLDSNSRPQNQISDIFDTPFACFGALCNQGTELGIILKYRAILSCIYMLSWVLISCFSSQIYIVMTRSILVPPFWSLETLFHGTDYRVLVENSTAAFRAFQERHEPVMGQIIDARRVEFHKGFGTLWEKACSYDQKNAAYHFTYQYPKSTFSNIACELEPTGESERTTCIAALVPKDFTHRKTLNYGIMKLHEFGIISAAKSRWIREKPDMEIRSYSPIIFEQIHFPLGVYFLGSCCSVITLIIERICRRQQIPTQQPTRKHIG